MAREQVAVELSQARNARRESEEARKANIEDLAKLARAVVAVMTGLGVPYGLMLPDRLVKEVRHLSRVIKEPELPTAQRVVHRVLAMFDSHYQGLERMALRGGWAPDISDMQCDELDEDCATFARDMADAALKDLELLPKDASEDLGSSRPSA
jgi:hypothetical protein